MEVQIFNLFPAANKHVFTFCVLLFHALLSFFCCVNHHFVKHFGKLSVEVLKQINQLAQFTNKDPNEKKDKTCI